MRARENKCQISQIETNCPERVVCSGVAHISISDHSLVYAFRKLSINFRKGHTSITYVQKP